MRYAIRISIIAVIGGGAAGLACAVLLARAKNEVVILERGERVGKKLSATGNGQGNVTNLNVSAAHYFSDDREKVGRILARFSAEDAVAFLEGWAVFFCPIPAEGSILRDGRRRP